MSKQFAISKTVEYWTFESNLTFTKKSLQVEDDVRKEKFRSFSQAEQDIMVYKIFEDKFGGFYVDLAANKFDHLSNTYGLDIFNGWKGICIEPNPYLRKDLLKYRKCSLYVNPVSNTAGGFHKFRFESHGDSAVGGLVGEDFDNKGDKETDVQLVMTTLTRILDHCCDSRRTYKLLTSCSCS
jgi:hypothetical protein